MMFIGLSEGEVCDDCKKPIAVGDKVTRDERTNADSSYRRCELCQRKANYNPMNQSASINPFNY